MTHTFSGKLHLIWKTSNAYYRNDSNLSRLTWLVEALIYTAIRKRMKNGKLENAGNTNTSYLAPPYV